MRISTTQIFQSGVSAMQRAQTNLNHTSLQMATGRRILTPSDDPSGAAQSLTLQSAITSTKQYQRNVDLAQPRLEQEESQLDAVTNYVQRARELIVAAGNDTYNASNRVTMANEIRSLRDGILAIANSQDANGEYLFAGTKSFDQPFTTNAQGAVSYVGADGVDAVREVAVSATRSIRIGDTGRSVFMDVPEKSGKILEAVVGPANQGSLAAKKSEVTDQDAFALHAKDTFRIQFSDDGSGNVVYKVVDGTGATIKDESGNLIEDKSFTDGDAINFAGRSVTLTGTANDGDTVTSRPAPTVSIFDTLDAIATALETPATDDATRAKFAEATSAALLNIDSGLGQVNEVRTSVGLRLQTLDTQTSLNDQRVVDLKTSLSDVSDLDYAEAISRYKLQEVVLQAAQQTYAQTSKLSLFDFL